MERIGNLKGDLIEKNIPKGEPVVLYELQDAVAIITLNDPKSLNSLSRKMITGITTYMGIAASDNKVKVVLLKGSGKFFCAGANIKELEGETFQSRVFSDHFMDLKVFFQNYTKPIIAAVHNLAFGGGFELALLCDIIVANRDCKFAFPEIKLGVFPGLAGTLIAKVIGRYNTTKLILTGEPVSATEGKAMQFVSEVLESTEACQKYAFDLAQKISGFSSTALILAKKAIKFSADESGTLAQSYESLLFNPV
jgi:enoyl-CoA hydratase/carnithine racemase